MEATCVRGKLGTGEIICEDRDHLFIPATTGGPPTLLQGDGARGPYRYSTCGTGGLGAGGGARDAAGG